MTYATPEDMELRFGEQFGAGDRSRAEAALEDAAAEIDSALGGAYGLPLPADARPLKGIACDLAWLRFNDAQAPEAVTQRATAALERLANIAEGRSVLAAADGTPVPRIADAPGDGSGAMATGSEPVMQRSALGGL